jgi:hypothetical protein
MNNKHWANKTTQSRAILETWSLERRVGIDNGSRETMQNGRLLLNKSRAVTTVLRLVNSLLHLVPFLGRMLMRKLVADSHGYSNVAEGAFLADARGGRKLAQVWVRKDSSTFILSDQLFWKSGAVLTLLFLASPNQNETVELERVLCSAGLPLGLLAEKVFELQQEASSLRPPVQLTKQLKLYPISVMQIPELEEVGIDLIPRYDPRSFRHRFSPSSRFALVRPDHIVFSEAKSVMALGEQIKRAKELFS